MSDLFFDGDAGFSACQRYRYWLTRVWNRTLPVVAWVMLNPSTADAFVDDPTIRRCIAFSRAWGAGGLVVLNLFALRSTNPAALRLPGASPIDPPDDLGANDRHIRRWTEGRRVIAAWGVHGTLCARDRDVLWLLAGQRVECLGRTKGGHPWHPLYIKGATVPVPFGGVTALEVQA